jgi:hypothetical protein
MSTWRCGWTCPRSYFFAAVFLAGPIAALYLWEDDEVDGGANGAVCCAKGPK